MGFCAHVQIEQEADNKCSLTAALQFKPLLRREIGNVDGLTFQFVEVVLLRCDICMRTVFKFMNQSHQCVSRVLGHSFSLVRRARSVDHHRPQHAFESRLVGVDVETGLEGRARRQTQAAHAGSAPAPPPTPAGLCPLELCPYCLWEASVLCCLSLFLFLFFCLKNLTWSSGAPERTKKKTQSFVCPVVSRAARSVRLCSTQP